MWHNVIKSLISNLYLTEYSYRYEGSNTTMSNAKHLSIMQKRSICHHFNAVFYCYYNAAQKVFRAF